MGSGLPLASPHLPLFARHLPLFQCIVIAFRMFFLSVSFIVPLVQCYSSHCLATMLIAQPMMMQQRCDMFHIALNNVIIQRPSGLPSCLQQSVVGARIAAINLFQLDLDNHDYPYDAVKLAPPPFLPF